MKNKNLLIPIILIILIILGITFYYQNIKDLSSNYKVKYADWNQYAHLNGMIFSYPPSLLREIDYYLGDGVSDYSNDVISDGKEVDLIFDSGKMSIRSVVSNKELQVSNAELKETFNLPLLYINHSNKGKYEYGEFIIHRYFKANVTCGYNIYTFKINTSESGYETITFSSCENERSIAKAYKILPLVDDIELQKKIISSFIFTE